MRVCNTLLGRFSGDANFASDEARRRAAREVAGIVGSTHHEVLRPPPATSSRTGRLEVGRGDAPLSEPADVAVFPASPTRPPRGEGCTFRRGQRRISFGGYPKYLFSPQCNTLGRCDVPGSVLRHVESSLPASKSRLGIRHARRFTNPQPCRALSAAGLHHSPCRNIQDLIRPTSSAQRPRSLSPRRRRRSAPDALYADRAHLARRQPFSSVATGCRWPRRWNCVRPSLITAWWNSRSRCQAM